MNPLGLAEERRKTYGGLTVPRTASSLRRPFLGHPRARAPSKSTIRSSRSIPTAGSVDAGSPGDRSSRTTPTRRRRSCWRASLAATLSNHDPSLSSSRSRGGSLQRRCQAHRPSSATHSWPVARSVLARMATDPRTPAGRGLDPSSLGPVRDLGAVGPKKNTAFSALATSRSGL